MALLQKNNESNTKNDLNKSLENSEIRQEQTENFSDKLFKDYKYNEIYNSDGNIRMWENLFLEFSEDERNNILLEAIKSDDVNIRIWSAETIRKFHSFNEKIVNCLIQAVKSDPDNVVRRLSTDALREYGKMNNEIMEVLIIVLLDKNEDVFIRLSSLIVLGNNASYHIEIGYSLVKLFEDTEPWIKLKALEYLENIEMLDSSYVNRLIDFLCDQDSNLVNKALMLISKLAAEDNNILPIISLRSNELFRYMPVILKNVKFKNILDAYKNIREINILRLAFIKAVFDVTPIKRNTANDICFICEEGSCTIDLCDYSDDLFDIIEEYIGP